MLVYVHKYQFMENVKHVQKLIIYMKNVKNVQKDVHHVIHYLIVHPVKMVIMVVQLRIKDYVLHVMQKH